MKQVGELFVCMPIKDERAVGTPIARSYFPTRLGSLAKLRPGSGSPILLLVILVGSHDWGQAGSSKASKCLHGR
jgi:hypothetical protein